MSKNAFNPANGPVSIFVNYPLFPGLYSLCIYNSAGELVKKLATEQLSGPIRQSYLWDGLNTYGNKCASGVYILYLIEPESKKIKRVLLVD